MITTKIKKKYRKLSQAYKYRQKADSQACFWHLGSPNFGDDLNPYLFESLLGRPVFRDAKQQSVHLLGVGSILERANENSIVVGSGFIRPDSTLTKLPKAILAVRGKLTEERVGGQGLLLGDPGILVPHLLGITASQQEEVVLVPHVDSYRQVAEQYGNKYPVVDPSMEFAQVIAQIARAKFVLSQSLHGLVMADAMSIPSVWIAPHGGMIGGEYKFFDYFSSTMQEKQCLSFDAALENQAYKKAAQVSTPLIPVTEYLAEYKHLVTEASKVR